MRATAGRSAAGPVVATTGLVSLIVLLGAAVVFARGRAALSTPADATVTMRLLPVTAVGPLGCPPGGNAGASWVPGTDSPSCYRVTTGVTVTGPHRVRAIRPGPADGGQWRVAITFQGADAANLTALTTRLSGNPSPRNRLAIVVGRTALSAPEVREPITGGAIQLSGPFTEAEAARMVGDLGG